MRIRRQEQSPQSRSRGAAAAECALASPLLVVLVMGVIDAGQLTQVAQVVSNASREGARYASRDTVFKKMEVKNAVLNYLQGAFPNATSSQISSATTVTVRNSSGTDLTDSESNGALQTVASGESVSVEVSFQYSSVRWMEWFPYLNSKTLVTDTVMRRE